MAYNPAFFQAWLSEEVAPKTRMIRDFLGFKDDEKHDPWSDFIYSEIVRLGISPYHYWLGEHPRPSSSGVSASPSPRASSLSTDLLGRCAAIGLEVGSSNDRARIPPGRTIEKEAFLAIHKAFRGAGFRYVPENREWVPA